MSIHSPMDPGRESYPRPEASRSVTDCGSCLVLVPVRAARYQRGMKRRHFMGLAGLTLAAARRAAQTPAGERSAAPTRPGDTVPMHLGCQRGPTTGAMLQEFRRHGVEHICGYPPNPGARGHWSLDELARTREL